LRRKNRTERWGKIQLDNGKGPTQGEKKKRARKREADVREKLPGEKKIALKRKGRVPITAPRKIPKGKRTGLCCVAKKGERSLHRERARGLRRSSSEHPTKGTGGEAFRGKKDLRKKKISKGEKILSPNERANGGMGGGGRKTVRRLGGKKKKPAQM